jgi:hypothetical protein
MYVNYVRTLDLGELFHLEKINVTKCKMLSASDVVELIAK